jgi:hypothetical protein
MLPSLQTKPAQGVVRIDEAESEEEWSIITAKRDHTPPLLKQ